MSARHFLERQADGVAAGGLNDTFRHAHRRKGSPVMDAGAELLQGREMLRHRISHVTFEAVARMGGADPEEALAALAVAVERLGGTRHLVGAPTATSRDLAQAVVDELELPTEVRATTSDKFVRPAKRAAVSILRVTTHDTPSMGAWRDGVRASLLHIKQGTPVAG